MDTYESLNTKCLSLHGDWMWCQRSVEFFFIGFLLVFLETNSLCVLILLNHRDWKYEAINILI